MSDTPKATPEEIAAELHELSYLKQNLNEAVEKACKKTVTADLYMGGTKHEVKIPVALVNKLFGDGDLVFPGGVMGADNKVMGLYKSIHKLKTKIGLMIQEHIGDLK